MTNEQAEITNEQAEIVLQLSSDLAQQAIKSVTSHLQGNASVTSEHMTLAHLSCTVAAKKIEDMMEHMSKRKR